MTNDQAPMTKECPRSNDQGKPMAATRSTRQCFAHWTLVILWSLVIGTWSFLTTGCQQQMADQPSYGPLESSAFFADGQASRPVVPGTVARGQLRDDPHLYEGITGKNDKGEKQYVTEFPFPVTREVLIRGQERFNIFCSVCHGREGKGDGIVVERGFTRPPAYFPVPERRQDGVSRGYKPTGKEVPLTETPVGYFFDVITNGYGAMPDLASEVPVNDRWAIIAYIRALQEAGRKE
jgi:hypothetical protein